jgi:hypothetical protein
VAAQVEQDDVLGLLLLQDIDQETGKFKGLQGGSPP